MTSVIVAMVGVSPHLSVCVGNFVTRKTQIIAHEMLFIQSSCSVTIPPLQRSSARWRNTTEQISTGDNRLPLFFAGDNLFSPRGSLTTRAHNFYLCRVFSEMSGVLASALIAKAGNKLFILKTSWEICVTQRTKS